MHRATFTDSYGLDVDGSMDTFKVEASPAATYLATTVARAITAPVSPRPVRAFATARMLLTGGNSQDRVKGQAETEQATPVSPPFRELKPWVPSGPMGPESDWDVPHDLDQDEEWPEPRPDTPITRLVRHLLETNPQGLTIHNSEWNLLLYRQLEAEDMDGWWDTPYPYLVKDLMRYMTPSPSTPELEWDSPCDEYLDEDEEDSIFVDDAHPQTPASP